MKEIGITANDVMSYKGLSVYLKMSQGTLRQKVMNGTIPFSKIGSSVRFSKKTIDAWLEENHKSTKKKKQRTENKEQGDMGGGELFPADGGCND